MSWFLAVMGGLLVVRGVEVVFGQARRLMDGWRGLLRQERRQRVWQLVGVMLVWLAAGVMVAAGLSELVP